MQTIGERLEEARKKKGISIREAAEATKIRGDYLSKFENNQFDINLTELYVRGFLRTYAHFLRLPADRIINDYAALGRGEARPRQPSREIYGRMDVSIVSADERGEPAAAVAQEPAPVVQPARRTTGAGRRVGTSPGTNIDPALVFKVGKWAGIALVGVFVIWGLIFLVKSATTTSKPTPSTATAAGSIVQASEPTITIIALDTVRLSVKVKNPDGTAGEVLLPDVTLSRGERRVVPKRGALYLTATALENVALEENGRTQNIRDKGITGYSRVQIGP
jgi:transcriptional regulator with XRE-family HTH domain